MSFIPTERCNLANIRIIIDDPNTGTIITVPDAPDNWEANRLVQAIVNLLKLPQYSNGIPNRYGLVRVRNAQVLKHTDTLKGIGSAESEVYAILPEVEVLEYSQELLRDRFLRFPSFWELFFRLVLGIFFIVFSFPQSVMSLGKILGWSLVQNSGAIAQSVLNSLFGASDSTKTTTFNNLLLGLTVVLIVYFVLLTALALRHGRFYLFGLGILFLFVGAACLQLLAWVIYLLGWLLYIVIIILAFVFRILGIILGFLGHILGFLIRGVWWLLVTIFDFLIGSGWWLLALLLVGVGIYLAVRYRSAFFKAILWVLGTIGILAVIVGVVYGVVKLVQFLSPIIRPILEGLGSFFAIIFAFIGRVLGIVFLFLFYLLFGLLICNVVYGFGALLIDQFKGAWNSGNGKRGIILGSLSIGTSLALVLLESNLGGVDYFYPTVELQHFVITTFYQANPIFDISLTLLIVGVSMVGLLRNFAKLLRGPGWRQFQLALVLAVPILLVGVVLIAIMNWLKHYYES